MLINDEKLPFVSVLAPCRNEKFFIANTIESIINSDYPSDRIELLILDGMSNDGTREIVQQYIEKYPNIKLVDNPDKIVPTAMNIGIERAQGEYIVRIDCHSWFASDYIRKCIEVSQKTGADNVGGYGVTCPGSDSAVAMAIAHATSCSFGVGNASFRIGEMVEKEVDTVPFGTYRKDHFKKYGMYDERLVRNQDIELNSRIRANGGKIIISPEIKLKYFNRASYSGIWQQSFNNGLWNPYTIWLVGGGLCLRHFVPMFFVFSLLLLSVISIFLPYVLILLFADLALYLGCALHFARKAAKEKRGNVILIFWTFIVMHVAYGLGSLKGVLTVFFKFPNRNAKSIGKVIADRKY